MTGTGIHMLDSLIALAGGAPYPISTGEMLDTVAAFEAIAEGAKSDGRVQGL